MTARFRRILIVGAGEAGRMVAAELAAHPDSGAKAVGFLDDDTHLTGKRIAGIPVLGRIAELEAVAARRRADEVVISIPTAPGRLIRCLVKRCREAALPCKIVPGIMEIIKGEVRIDQIRDVRVEDLLGRETVDFDIASARRSIAGKAVLVTGAGGSIGSELCRQLARLEPRSLMLLGRGENRLFDIEEDLGAIEPRIPVTVVVSDLRDAGRTDRIVRDAAPDIVYHAAAHKHVHYMERDPEEAVINNVEGSLNLVGAAERHGVSRFVFISTDKAADAIGVMGATKRLVELHLRSASSASRCRYITVRFGNVIGSTGSVVPLFIKQIRRGGPITISDPRATRYFMTVKEASLLVIRASVIGKGGETFILDMGEPLNILEMAQDIVLLSGHEPESEIPIVITGLREGEKLHEGLVSRDESLEPTEEAKIMLAKPASPVPPDLEAGIGDLVAAAHRGDRARVLEILAALVPGFGGGAAPARNRKRTR